MGADEASGADLRELDELQASMAAEKSSLEAERDAWKHRQEQGATDAARLRQRVAELETTVASASAAEAALQKERDAWKAQHDELNAPERTGENTVRDLEEQLGRVADGKAAQALDAAAAADAASAAL